MPIHLPPISRRRFLTCALAAGTGVVLSPRLLAAGKEMDADAWALLADTHIAAARSRVVRGVNMSEHLAAVVREVIASDKRFAGVMVAGDCAHDSGEKADYTTFAELLAPIRAEQNPIHIALGNHDHRERFWEALQQEKAANRPVVDRQAAFLTGARVNWFMLDSLEKTLSTPGLLGQGQLDWLAAALDANDQKPALLLVHHNPGKIENIEGLKDTEALQSVIRSRKQVKACFFGHTHKWSATQDESGVHWINLPPIAYVFREGNPSGWVRATLAEAGIKLELRCIDPAHPEHGKVTELRWRS